MKFSEKRFLSLLRTQCFGQRLIYVDNLPSTNPALMELAEAGEAEGLLLLAESQSAGRGRQANSWYSPAHKNLYFSLLLRPKLSLRRLPELALLSALALKQAIENLLPSLQIGLKWPNDLWVGGKKISGILCEGRDNTQFGLQAIVGIGLNINCSLKDLPENLHSSASSLFIESGEILDRTRVLAEILQCLENYYYAWQKEDNFAKYCKEWQKADVFFNKSISIKQNKNTISGIAEGIAEDGRLKLRLQNGEIILISSGEASRLRKQ